MSRRGRHEGSIYQRSDGRWCGTIDDGYRDGRRVRKSYYGETRGEVAERLKKALRDQQQRLPLPDERQTLEAFLGHWRDSTVKARVRPSTFRRYSDIIKRDIVPELGRVPIARLEPAHVSQLHARCLAKGYSARTVGRVHEVLRAALNDALRWSLVGRNVAALVRPPRPEAVELQPWSAAESRAFLAAVAEHRLEALFVLALGAGLRRGELLALRWGDVDLKAKTLTVAGALQRVKRDGAKHSSIERVETKSRTSRRTIGLPDFVARALRRRRARQAQEQLLAGERWHGTDLVFASRHGKPLDGDDVGRTFRRLVAKTGARPVRFHDTRHSCATLLLELGVSPRVVQEVLGHSSVQLTLGTYSHVSLALQREAAAALDREIGGL